ITRVAVAGDFAAENPVQLFQLVVGERRRGVDRGRGGDCRTRLLPVTRMHGFGVNLHGYFLFQRTPSLVSSRTTPWSNNSWRMRSAPAKSFAFLACVRR